MLHNLAWWSVPHLIIIECNQYLLLGCAASLFENKWFSLMPRSFTVQVKKISISFLAFWKQDSGPETCKAIKADQRESRKVYIAFEQSGGSIESDRKC